MKMGQQQSQQTPIAPMQQRETSPEPLDPEEAEMWRERRAEEERVRAEVCVLFLLCTSCYCKFHFPRWLYYPFLFLLASVEISLLRISVPTIDLSLLFDSVFAFFLFLFPFRH